MHVSLTSTPIQIQWLASTNSLAVCNDGTTVIIIFLLLRVLLHQEVLLFGIFGFKGLQFQEKQK